nr:hypothetical protein [Tanacetum cinerariifolium]
MGDDRVFCRLCTCERFRRNYMDKLCSICCFESGNAFIDDLIANSFDDLPNSSDHPFESYHDNLNYGYPPQEPFEYLENSSIAITPVLLIEEPDNSLSMRDEHLDTIPETESDEVIKSSVEDLVPIPSESEGIFYNMYDVPFSDKNHFDAKSDLIESLLTRDTSIVYFSKIDSLLEEFAGELVHIDPIPPGIDEIDSDPNDDIRFIEQLLYDDTSSEDDSFKNIDYVEASPPDSELVSLEESPSSSFLSYTDNSSPEFETFSYHTEETSSGSTTTLANNSLPEYDSFLFEIEPDQGELTSIVMNDILDNSTNDPLMEEIDLFLASDNLIPSGIENVDYDSEGDIFSLKNCLEMIPFPFLSLNHFILIFMMNHHLLVLRKNHLMMVAF